MTTFSQEIVQRFTLCSDPLTEVSADTEFICNACRTPGSGTRYRCEICDLNLHQFCVDCPMEISSFMHQHSLKLVGRKADHVCNLCEDPIEGLFYRCELCDFDVHPICTQLPERIRHERHKDHPLRLEISEPIGCVVCKDICKWWRYRCEVCNFHLHLDCVLAPCEEETVMPTTKTRSLRTTVPPPPQPSAWASAFGAYNSGHGYGGIPPPSPYFAQHSFPPNMHGYGGISPPPPPPQYFAQPPVGPLVHGYGGIVVPPPYNLAQSPFSPLVHGYGSIVMPPPQYFAQTSFLPHGHGHEAPSTSHAQSSGSNVQSHGGKVRKTIFALVTGLGGLALNVAGSIIADVLV